MIDIIGASCRTIQSIVDSYFGRVINELYSESDAEISQHLAQSDVSQKIHRVKAQSVVTINSFVNNYYDQIIDKVSIDSIKKIEKYSQVYSEKTVKSIQTASKSNLDTFVANYYSKIISQLEIQATATPDLKFIQKIQAIPDFQAKHRAVMMDIFVKDYYSGLINSIKMQSSRDLANFQASYHSN